MRKVPVFYKNRFSKVSMLQSVLAKFILLSVAAVAISACNSSSLSTGLQDPEATHSISRPASEPVDNQSSPDLRISESANSQSLPNQLQPALAGQASTQEASTQLAALPSGKAVAFLPVSNAPQRAVTSLARSIRKSALQKGVAVVGSVKDGAQYQVKGYFSALEDGSGTLLVYVWDVLDRNNKRVYRINGQVQSGATRSADPWGSVTPQMLDRVASSTVTQLKSWLARR